MNIIDSILPKDTHCRRLLVKGIVQGVGFRPFVARLARGLGLAGSVANTGRGVEITLFGSVGKLEEFAARLKSDAPPMALIMEVIEEEPAQVAGAKEPCAAIPADFTINASRTDPTSSVIIPPDIATCDACVRELGDEGDRRGGYAFINCTDCGPRYTIIDSIPYDRPRTAMSGFELCDECRREYEDQDNRRFHAQPNACPVCGPTLKALDAEGNDIAGDPLVLARQALARGETVALLGIGGFHLACDATSEEAVARLRERKQRPAKPFAVMAADMQVAATIAEIDDDVAALLTSPAAPIVLCPELEGANLAPSIAPGQSLVGIFLPYTPLHHLLFTQTGGAGDAKSPGALVMTSGNRSDEPIISSWRGAAEKLLGVADLFVVHNRPIIHPVDDSVVKSDQGLPPLVVRRARGYAPKPLPLANGAKLPVTLCLGAELSNTFAVVRDALVFVGPHVGDLKNLDTEEVYTAGVDHLLELLEVTPELVVADLHPHYRSTAYAEIWRDRGVELVQVQHHEAHAAACMGEHNFGSDALALTLDGVGLGHDGTLWGGELLAGRPGSFERAAHLGQVPLPGGDAAAKEPWRMAAAHLRQAYGAQWTGLKLPAFDAVGAGQIEGLEQMMAQGLNCPPTSSCGRLFDAAAAILGFAGPMLYSAQAPMELEALAASAMTAGGAGGALAGELYPGCSTAEEGGGLVLDASPLIRALYEEISAYTQNRGGEEYLALKSLLALKFHEALARSWAEVVALESERRGLKEVFLSGGCFQNSVLTALVKQMVEARGLKVALHRQLPPNDGGISFGQAAWVALSGKWSA